MKHLLAIPAAWTVCTLVSFGQHSVIPGFDFVKSSASHSGGMGFDNGSGDVEISRFDIRSALTNPLTPAPGLTFVPLAQYRVTLMDFSNIAGGFPLDDMDLHSLSVSGFALQSCEGSPWLFGAWGRIELASDLRHISSDSFTFDLAAGAGYRINDQLIVAMGGALLNLNGDTTVLPGIALDWTPSDSLRVGLYGPNFIASWEPAPKWMLSLRGDTAGDIWTAESGGRARAIDLSSYRVGLHAERCLGGDLWLRIGGGITLANELELTTIRGSKIAGGDMDDGWFGEISLRLVQW
jgi:hypothetical protein